MVQAIVLLCALLSHASSLPLDQSEVLKARQERIVSAVASLVAALGLDVVGADEEETSAFREHLVREEIQCWQICQKWHI
jgi:hypothetical protein